MSKITRASVAATLGALALAAPAGATTVGESEQYSWAGRYLEVRGPAITPSHVVVSTVNGRRQELRIVERKDATVTAMPGSGPLGSPIACVTLGGLRSATCRADVAMSVHGAFGGAADIVDARALPEDTFGFDIWSLGAGDDTFRGGPGQDSVSPGPGDDTVIGAESVDYTNDRGGVRVSLDDLANDGERGTGNIAGSPEVTGSRGSDTLVGNDGDNWLHGGYGGPDTLAGLGGADILFSDGGRVDGGDGSDDIRAAARFGPVDVLAGPDADTVSFAPATEHPATIDLGAGDDTLRFGLAPGHPQLPVTVSCGDGHDTVTNVAGTVTVAADCEVVSPAP